MFQPIFLFTTLTLLSSTILCDKTQNVELSSSVTTETTSVKVVDEKGPPSPTSEELENFRAFKNSSLYVAPYEDDILSIPVAQLKFIRSSAKVDLELIRTILREAIDKRNNLISPSVTLMWKYSGKLLGNFIRNRQAEQRLEPRVDPKPSFFNMLAQIVEKVLDRSSELKKENHYDKISVLTEELYERANNTCNYISKIIDNSPIGGYIKWNTTVLFKSDTSKTRSNLDLVEEIADQTAVSIT